MKYKVGDKVRIKNKEWYEDNCNRYGILECGDYEFFEPMNEYCGEVVTITRVDDCYRVNIDKGAFCWTDEMIECKVEESKPNIIEEAKTYWDSIKDAWVCPEGYQFKDENGNVINATKIVLEKKKKEYPKTYEECCEVLGHVTIDEVRGYKATLLDKLQMLLVCRDAYWKIAGEEMGLGKPWYPNWHDDEKKYTIEYYDGEIIKDVSLLENRILVFPTAEMRDAFYENFKSEIEICKELL